MRHLLFALCMAAGLQAQDFSNPNWVQNVSPKQFDWKSGWTDPNQWFQWQPVNIHPKDVGLFQKQPAPAVCAVPLLAAPLDPKVDTNMPKLRPPKSPLERADIVKAMPACPKDRLK